ncbi:MAG: CBS domain-containing protein [Nanoarchaeota archaeon]|nr:CBS domain-containing protein [Nanoarchaeota archaeon]MBU4452540.1 CBS domain-containing protein [Nanoarchaeota archaeon]MCG2723505.1 CBS domain-containing protein [archaeon]
MLPDEEDLAVSNIMTKKVAVADAKDTVQKVAMQMREKNIRGIPIVLKNKIVGMLTDKDIVSKVVAENKSPRDVTAGEIMSPKIITASPGDSITDVAKIMYANNVGRIPVIDEKGNLVGIVTETDITKIAPGIIDILYAHVEIENGAPPIRSRHPTLEGRCEECGQVYDDLVDVEGQWLCRSCSEDKTVVGTEKK